MRYLLRALRAALIIRLITLLLPMPLTKPLPQVPVRPVNWLWLATPGLTGRAVQPAIAISGTRTTSRHACGLASSSRTSRLLIAWPALKPS